MVKRWSELLESAALIWYLWLRPALLRALETRMMMAVCEQGWTFLSIGSTSTTGQAGPGWSLLRHDWVELRVSSRSGSRGPSVFVSVDSVDRRERVIQILLIQSHTIFFSVILHHILISPTQINSQEIIHQSHCSLWENSQSSEIHRQVVNSRVSSSNQTIPFSDEQQPSLNRQRMKRGNCPTMASWKY